MGVALRIDAGKYHRGAHSPVTAGDGVRPHRTAGHAG